MSRCLSCGAELGTSLLHHCAEWTTNETPLESAPSGQPEPAGIPEPDFAKARKILFGLKTKILPETIKRDLYALESVLSQAEERLALLSQQLAKLTLQRNAARLEKDWAMAPFRLVEATTRLDINLPASLIMDALLKERAGWESENAQLRKDRERMDLLENNSPDKVYFRDGKEISCRGQTLRSTIDNATHYLCSGAARSASPGETPEPQP